MAKDSAELITGVLDWDWALYFGSEGCLECDLVIMEGRLAMEKRLEVLRRRSRLSPLDVIVAVVFASA